MCPRVVFLLVGLGLLAAAGSCTAGADEPVASSVRYNREIVRIFERKCVTCHADAGLAMPLDSYHDVRPWARAIREEILERRMPPWPAAPGVRPLANELALTTREIAILTAWIDGGTPRGEPSDLPQPKPSPMWKAGAPALTLTLPPQQVKSDGNPYMRRVTIDTELRREEWLRGFDVKPGAHQALRSVFLYSRDAGGQQWLGGWTPWYAMTQGPENVGFRLRKGATLDVELHYAAWDESERTLTDASVVALYFHSERPASVVEGLTVSASGSAPQQDVRAEAVLPADTTLWAIRPEITQDGSAQPVSLELRAILPGGRTEPLLWVRDHRPDWQVPYVLREPLRLPRDARIVLAAHGKNIASANVAASLLMYRAAAPAKPTAEPLKRRAQRRPVR